MDSDELGTPPTPPRLTRGVPHTPEPPSPPRLTRSEGIGFTGRMQRRPSHPLEGDDWISRFMSNASPVTPVTPRELFESPRSSGSWTDTTEEDINVPTWWFEMPEKFMSDVFWNHMFQQPDFFLLEKKIRPEKREAIDTIMGLLPIKVKGIYDTRSRTHTLKNPFPKVVNVAFVKQFLMNLTPLSLTPEDSYRFKMMIMNFFMFAPMNVLEGYIDRLTRRGGKTKKRRKYKTKRV